MLKPLSYSRVLGVLDELGLDDDNLYELTFDYDGAWTYYQVDPVYLVDDTDDASLDYYEGTPKRTRAQHNALIGRLWGGDPEDLVSLKVSPYAYQVSAESGSIRYPAEVRVGLVIDDGE